MIKNKRAFTLVELLAGVAIAAVFIALLIPALATLSRRKNISSNPAASLNVGDTVYIDGLNVTGKVNRISFGYATLLMVGTNGVPVVLDNIDANVLTKVVNAER